MSISKGPCESDWLPWDVIGPPKSQPFCMFLAHLLQTNCNQNLLQLKWWRKSSTCKRDVSLVDHITDHDEKKSHHKLLIAHYLILFFICWLPFEIQINCDFTFAICFFVCTFKMEVLNRLLHSRWLLVNRVGITFRQMQFRQTAIPPNRQMGPLRLAESITAFG